MDMLLNEIPHASSPHLRLHRHQQPPDGRLADALAGGDGVADVRGNLIHGVSGGAPFDGPSLSHGLLSSFAHGYGLLSGGDGRARWSPQPLPSEGLSLAPSLLSGTPSPPGDDGGWHFADKKEPGLISKFRAMQLAGDREAPNRIPSVHKSLLWSNPIEPSLSQTNYARDLGVDSQITDSFMVSRCSALPGSTFFDSDNRSYASGSQQRCSIDANLSGYYSMPNNFLHGEEALHTDGLHSRTSSYRGGQILLSQPPVRLPSSISTAFLKSRHIGTEHNWDLSSVDQIGIRHGWFPNGGHDVDVLDAFSTLSLNTWDSQLALQRDQNRIEAFTCKDGLIVQGKGLTYVRNQNRAHDYGADKRLQLNANHDLEQSRFVNLEIMQNSTSPPLPGFQILPQGYIYCMARDQRGCRLLQKKFDEGKHQIDVIFNEVICYLGELMVNPFGNYLIQKLLDVCDEEQRMKIVLVLTEDPAMLVEISLNIHGTRAIQKLIETLEKKQEIALLVSAMQPRFLDIIRDINGNHVVQRCLQCFDAEDNKLIFDAAVTYCIKIATQRHGCCVLPRCLDKSTGQSRAKLVAEICSHGVQLAQDAFGNYVVQYVLDLGIPEAAASLASKFEQNYVQLAKQKFSSNVVEKCLEKFAEEDRATIIYELLSDSQFDRLIQDPFANYVIFTALQVSKGTTLYNALAVAIRPCAKVLRANPYSKRIISHVLSKN